MSSYGKTLHLKCFTQYNDGYYISDYPISLVSSCFSVIVSSNIQFYKISACRNAKMTNRRAGKPSKHPLSKIGIWIYNDHNENTSNNRLYYLLHYSTILVFLVVRNDKWHLFRQILWNIENTFVGNL